MREEREKSREDAREVFNKFSSRHSIHPLFAQGRERSIEGVQIRSRYRETGRNKLATAARYSSTLSLFQDVNLFLLPFSRRYCAIKFFPENLARTILFARFRSSSRGMSRAPFALNVSATRYL